MIEEELDQIVLCFLSLALLLISAKLFWRNRRRAHRVPCRWLACGCGLAALYVILNLGYLVLEGFFNIPYQWSAPVFMAVGFSLFGVFGFAFWRWSNEAGRS